MNERGKLDIQILVMLSVLCNVWGFVKSAFFSEHVVCIFTVIFFFNASDSGSPIAFPFMAFPFIERHC